MSVLKPVGEALGPVLASLAPLEPAEVPLASAFIEAEHALDEVGIHELPAHLSLFLAE